MPMPRMSKKKKIEWSIFLDKRNRITYNKLCLTCRKECKQSFRVKVIQCPQYQKKEDLKNGKTRNHKSKFNKNKRD